MRWDSSPLWPQLRFVLRPPAYWSVAVHTWFAEEAISWGITLQYKNGVPLQLFPYTASMEKPLVSPRKLPLSFLSGSKKDSLVALPPPSPSLPIAVRWWACPMHHRPNKSLCWLFANFEHEWHSRALREWAMPLGSWGRFFSANSKFYCTFLIRISAGAGPCFLSQGVSLQCLKHCQWS